MKLEILRHVTLAAMTETSISVPYIYVMSLQFIWRSGTRSSNELQGLDYIILRQGSRIIATAMGHYSDVILSPVASQITSLTVAYSTVYPGRSNKVSKLCATGLCGGNSPVTGEFPTQRASNAENVSIWWRHHVGEQYYSHSNGHCLILNENCWFSSKISSKHVPSGLADNKWVLVQIMTWCRTGDRPLSNQWRSSILTHICVTRLDEL